MNVGQFLVDPSDGNRFQILEISPTGMIDVARPTDGSKIVYFGRRITQSELTAYGYTVSD